MNVSIVFHQQCRRPFAAPTPWSFFLIAVLFATTALRAQSAHYEGAQMASGGSGVALYGVAVDSQGNLWFADNYYNLVTEISPTGATLQSFSVYIAEYGGNNVLKETPATTAYGTTYSQSVLPTNGLSYPGGVAVDSHGKVYVGDRSNSRVIVLTPSGSSYTQSTLPASPQIDPVGLGEFRESFGEFRGQIAREFRGQRVSGTDSSTPIQSAVHSKANEEPRARFVSSVRGFWRSTKGQFRLRSPLG